MRSYASYCGGGLLMSAALRSTVLVYSGGACGVTGAAAGGAICGAVCGATPKASIALGCWVRREWDGHSKKYLVQFIQSKSNSNMFFAAKSSDFFLPATKMYKYTCKVQTAISLTWL